MHFWHFLFRLAVKTTKPAMLLSYADCLIILGIFCLIVGSIGITYDPAINQQAARYVANTSQHQVATSDNISAINNMVEQPYQRPNPTIQPSTDVSNHDDEYFILDFDTKVMSAAAHLQDRAVKNTFDITVKRGQTIASILTKQNVSPAQIYRFSNILKPYYSPNKIKPKDRIIGFIDPYTKTLQRLQIHLTQRQGSYAAMGFIISAQKNDTLNVLKVLTPYIRQTRFIQGVIELSLLTSLQQHKLHPTIGFAFADIFSFEIDFQRDIQPGNQYSLLFEQHTNPITGKVQGGKILRAHLTNRKSFTYYPFQFKNNVIGFFNSQGKSARRELLKTPIAAGRLSSNFGMRKHPILGYNKMHKGLDFAAKRGTPIFAAGDGIVEVAKRKGAYGKYIRIRHNATYKTAYAHLSSYAPKIRSGKSVKQGQVIGYVGSTGRSTGPHLHYEVIKHNKQINPSKLKLAHSQSLNKTQQASLLEYIQTTDRLIETTIASNVQ